MTAVARVLLVENHADTAQFLATLLRRDGFDVTVAARVDDAIRLCRENRFDLLACDIGLNDGDGTSILAAAREHCPGLPGIVVSAHADPAYRNAAAAVGFAEYLVKPLTYDAVLAAVRRTLGVGKQTS